MSNAILGFPCVSDTNLNPTEGASGYITPAFAAYGSWQAAFPLTNLQSPYLYKVARSTTASLANAKFRLDLGVTRFVNLFAFIRHNLQLPTAASTGGKYRIQAGIDNTYAAFLYDTGWLPAWPAQAYAPGSVPWGSPSSWTGRPTQADVAPYASKAFYHYASAIAQGVRYIQIEFDDTTNPYTYIELGRLFIGQAWQPQVNLAYGNELGWVDSSPSEESHGGVEFFDVRPVRRTAAFSFEDLSVDQALEIVFDMQSKLGRTGQLFWAFDPADTYHVYRRCFLATLESLDRLRYPYFNANTAAVQLKEVL